MVAMIGWNVVDRRSFIAGGLAMVVSDAVAGEPLGLAVIPRSDYYAKATRERWGSWGPPARQLPAPVERSEDPVVWAPRIIAAARRYIGLGYQHHHVPDFDPPANWPWREVSAGRNGPGLDCSNFTSLAFDESLGIKLPTAIGTQAAATAVAGPGGLGTARLSRLAPRSYDEAVATLRPADLLYIRSDAGRISHVVLWIGPENATPSIIDCTDAVRKNVDGSPIPTGVHVRPFLPNNWYGRRFAHAHRLESLGDGKGPTPVFGDGGDV